MTTNTTRLLAFFTALILATTLPALSGCSTQQKLFGKPSSSTAWQSAYEEKEKALASEADGMEATTEKSDRPITGDNTRYYLQLAAYSSRANAEAQLKKMKAALKHPIEIFDEQDNGQQFYKLQVGPFPSLQEAVRAEPEIRAAGFDKIRYIRR